MVTCQREGSEILKQEITNLGYQVESENRSDVMLSGSLFDCQRLNMFLRTGHRVLWQIGSFRASNPDELYKKVKELPWEKYLDPDGYICITSHAVNEHIKDTRFTNLRVKDAIADKMVAKRGRRPDSGPDRDKTVIFLYWVHDQAFIYFDTSGETIAKHNYRKLPYKAPLLESLASSIIMNTTWTADQHFISPMCGSGTLAIEAALIGLNMAPGLSRNNYGFMHFSPYNKEDWKKVKIEAHKKIKAKIKGRIIANDINPLAIEASKNNAAVADVEEFIEFQQCDFADSPIPEGDGIIIINPPYGERLGEIQELEKTYKNIGDFFKQKGKGKTGYVFTGNADLAKKIGLRTSRRIPYYNAKIECRLLQYALYSGSKKNKHESVD